MPMRPDRATAVQIGIDQFAQGRAGFEPGVELKTQLAADREIGTLAGSTDDLIDIGNCDALAGRIQTDCAQRVPLALDLGDADAADKFHLAGVAQCFERRTQLAARGQGVGFAAAKYAIQRRRAYRPHNARVRCASRKFGQREQGVRGGMTGTDDQGALARVALARSAQHVWNAVENCLRVVAFAKRGQAAGADRTRCAPGAAGIDDGAHAELGGHAVANCADHIGSAIAAHCFDLVEAFACDG